MTTARSCISLDLLDRLAHPDTIVSETRDTGEHDYLRQYSRQTSYFDEFWSAAADEKLLRVLNACGVHSTNYLYDAFYGDFSECLAAFVERPPKQGGKASVATTAKTFYHQFTGFLFGMAGEALRSGRSVILNRRRRCVLSGELFHDAEHGASVSFYRRRPPTIEALNYWVDISASRMDAFRRIGDPGDVLASMSDYRMLIDALGFYPAENSSEISLLSNLPRDRFYEVVRYMEKCFFPSRYAQVHGSHIGALFATGCLGPEPVVKTGMGYRAVAHDGHVCSSLAEKLIDDWLHRNGIPHEKEPAYPEAVRTLCGGNVRADWRIGDTYVEFFGLQTKTAYARKTEAKLAACLASGVHVLALYPGDETRLERSLAGLAYEMVPVTGGCLDQPCSTASQGPDFPSIGF